MEKWQKRVLQRSKKFKVKRVRQKILKTWEVEEEEMTEESDGIFEEEESAGESAEYLEKVEERKWLKSVMT